MTTIDERGPGEEVDTVVSPGQAPRDRAGSAPTRLRVDCAGMTHPGRVRDNNEDQYLVARLAKAMRVEDSSLSGAGQTRFSDEDGYLLIVADGMGGAAAGEKASSVAVETIETYALNTLKWFLHVGGAQESILLSELSQALERADRAVHARADSDYRLGGMGTTLTLAYTVGTDLYIAHAGDSRAYLLSDGHFRRLTHDHTLVQMLVDEGKITPEDAKHHHRRNVIVNVVGGPRHGVHADISKVQVGDGDVLLLCSDGLTEVVPDDQIAEALALHEDPQSAARFLVEKALAGGGPDNVTVVVARYALEVSD